MRKYLYACVTIALMFLVGWYLYFFIGVSMRRFSSDEATTFTRTEGKQILLQQDGAYQAFEIRGVDMGAGIAGHFATEFAISKSDYLRWFEQIQEMGANTIRVYTILGDDFYNAIYQYNCSHEQPLYVLHGLWLNDYAQFSHRDAYDEDIVDALMRDGHILVDVIHGKRNLNLGKDAGSGSYRKDISPWVIGYILGVEWEDVTVEFTNRMQTEENSYAGRYMYTTEEASPFEAMLAKVGDYIIEYETERYGTQRLVAFSNWPTTDPFDYQSDVARHFKKFTKVDVEHIGTTPNFHSGTFASYHVYPYYPDYLNYIGQSTDYIDPNGEINTYYAYLKTLTDYHSVPVVISEFGIPSSRGMAQRDQNTGRNQGGMSETDQAQALAECYRDIRAAGCAGSVIFTWQDEWFKRTWNTMYAVDLLKTPCWSDYQTNEQYFGILSFDPGERSSICYVDGDAGEWKDAETIAQNQDMTLSMRYDERFIYFLVRQPELSAGEALYIALDTTQKSGATYCENYDLKFDRAVDFVIKLQGEESRVVVQERYAVLRAMKGIDAYGISNPFLEPPAVDGTEFWPIDLLLQTPTELQYNRQREANPTLASKIIRSEIYETGKLVSGNANPDAPDYNSLADYCYGKGLVEIKLPWQLLNFANPAEMMIHDDYYEHYGVEYQKIRKMFVGVSPNSDERIALEPFRLKGWGKRVGYHERLKPAYYTMQALWK